MKTEELIKVKKYIEHVIGTIKHDGHLGRIQTEWIFPDLEKALAAMEGIMMNKSDCYTCGEEFEDNNCEFCSFAYPFCSQECYDSYMNEGSINE